MQFKLRFLTFSKVSATILGNAAEVLIPFPDANQVIFGERDASKFRIIPLDKKKQ